MKLGPSGHLNIIFIDKRSLFHSISLTNFTVFTFACHPVFIFVVYDVISKCKAMLGFSLSIMFDVWDKTEGLIKKLTYAQLIAIATEIMETN